MNTNHPPLDAGAVDPDNRSVTEAVRRRAWARWLGLAGLAVLPMLLVVPVADRVPLGASAWWLVPVFWLLLAVPATLAGYGHCFRPGYTGSAEAYLRGVTSLWSVLAAGVWLSMGSCLLAGSVTPGVWPAAMMLMLLGLARPTA